MTQSESKDVQPKPILGLSSCLAGETVRFDGGHKRHGYIMQTLGHFFTFRLFCPEVDIGLGIPREPIHLIATDKETEFRCVGIRHPEKDVTRKLKDSAKKQRDNIRGFSGYIVKKASPSCGMERVKVYPETGSNKMPANTGRGLFTQQMMRDFPLLPVEEEGRLGDPVLRENFIERVYIYFRWQQMLEKGLSAKALILFHTRHKFNILSHDQAIYRKLGPLIAGVTRDSVERIADEYIEQLMACIKKPATRGNHLNVLQHIQGYLADDLTADDKKELGTLLNAYHLGQIPRIVPITLLNHFFRKFPNTYIDDAYYMQPYPGEMKLLNFT